jgi:hypothetical protein
MSAIPTPTPWTDERAKAGTCDGWACCRELERRVDDVQARFAHLDSVLRECATADDPIYRTAAALWEAIAGPANARPHAEARSADSVQSDVGGSELKGDRA